MDAERKGTSDAALLGALYAIADADAFGAQVLPELVGVWAAVGVGSIQLRMKSASRSELFSVGRRCVDALNGSQSRLWINDSVAVARDLDAYGVHLGQTDMSPADARTQLGSHQRIGQSTHSLRQAQEADANPAVDVVALGPIFATASKANPDPVVGIDALQRVAAKVSKPLIAIGGVDHKNCRLAIGAGADAVAVIGALRWPASESEGFGSADLVRRRKASQAVQRLLIALESGPGHRGAATVPSSGR